MNATFYFSKFNIISVGQSIDNWSNSLIKWVFNNNWLIAMEYIDLFLKINLDLAGKIQTYSGQIKIFRIL